MLISEEYVHRIHKLLDSGLRFGFIGASDNHERNPGLGGGLTGLWAKGNTRADVFEAFGARRCFATTGLRPDLRMWVCGAFMGEETTATSSPTVDVQVKCSAPIRQIQIIRDGHTVHTTTHHEDIVCVNFTDADCPNGKHYYYVHIEFEGRQENLIWNCATAYGNHAWSSPVWVKLQKV